MRHFARLVGIGAALALPGCGGVNPPAPAPEVSGPLGAAAEATAAPAASPALAEPTEPGRERTTASGLTYETIRPGDGPQARFGDRVTLHYTAAIEGGGPIDSSRDRGAPWTHTVGDPRAVQGFNEGVAGMKVGERRRLVVPANLAYGSLGTFGEYAPGQERNLDGAMQADELPSVPPNSTIVYEVELLSLDSGPDAEAPPEPSPADAEAPPADGALR